MASLTNRANGRVHTSLELIEHIISNVKLCACVNKYSIGSKSSSTVTSCKLFFHCDVMCSPCKVTNGSKWLGSKSEEKVRDSIDPYYLPKALHTWNPVVLWQAAVREAVLVEVEVDVIVVVAKVNNSRPCPGGASNPGWTTKGTGSGEAWIWRTESTSTFCTGAASSSLYMPNN